MNGTRCTSCLVACLLTLSILLPQAEAKVKSHNPYQRRASTASKARKPPAPVGKVRRTTAAAPHRKNPPKNRPLSAAVRPPLRVKAPLIQGLPELELPEELMTAQLIDDAEPLEEAAFRMIGTRYRFGGNGTGGIDCSAFVQRVYSILNIAMPRTAREQYGMGVEVPQEEIRKGDLVFFQTYARYPSHVGIYLGDKRMIHASSGSRHVTISSMDTPYYRSRYLGARRLSDAEGSPIPQLLAGL